MLVVAACVCFALLDATAKWLVLSGLKAPFVAFVRFAVHTVFAALFVQIWRRPEALQVTSWPMQGIRGLCLFGSTILNFFALQTLQLAETVSIFFAMPMVVTALAGPMLGEWAGWRRWVAVLAGFGGVLVVTRPGFGVVGIGYAYVIGAMLCYSFYVILTRRMSATETPQSLIFLSAVVPTVLLMPVVPVYGSWPAEPVVAVLLILLGVFGALGHWLLIRAYTQAAATSLAIYPYSQMVWMIGLGWLVFGQFPDAWTMAGGAIIIASGLAILHRERQLRLTPTTPARHEAGDIAKNL
jgi:drug/metabolite transporter (DMT)-like permease